MSVTPGRATTSTDRPSNVVCVTDEVVVGDRIDQDLTAQVVDLAFAERPGNVEHPRVSTPEKGSDPESGGPGDDPSTPRVFGGRHLDPKGHAADRSGPVPAGRALSARS